MKIIGNIPNKNPAETKQFQRVLEILRRNSSLIGDWFYVLLDQKFSHKAGEIIDGDTDWNGQMDILLVSYNRIIIYELKGFVTEIGWGMTDSRRWVLKNRNSTRTVKRAYFGQASKQRAFLLQDFLNRFKNRYQNLSGNHWVVDSRIIFKNGSDFSGFQYSVPLTETQENLEEEIFLRLQNKDEIELLMRAFSGHEKKTGKLKRVRLEHNEYQLIKSIYARLHDELGYSTRVEKWFKIICENQIVSDLSHPGSDKFALYRDEAGLLIHELQHDYSNVTMSSMNPGVIQNANI